MAAAYALLAATRRPSGNLALAAGLLLAGAIVTRPAALVLAPLLVAPLFDCRWPWRARGHLVTAAGLGMGIGLALFWGLFGVPDTLAFAWKPRS